MTIQRFCTACGNPLVLGAQFCGSCGGRVVTVSPAASWPEKTVQEPNDREVAGTDIAAPASNSSAGIVGETLAGSSVRPCWAGMIFGAAMAVAAFLPWARFSASTEFLGYRSTSSIGAIYAIGTTYGVTAVVMGLAAIVLAARRVKFAAVLGVIALTDAAAFVNGVSNGRIDVSGDGFHASGGWEALYGLWIYGVAAFAYMAISLSYIRTSAQEEGETIPAPSRGTDVSESAEEDNDVAAVTVQSAERLEPPTAHSRHIEFIVVGIATICAFVLAIKLVGVK